MDRRLLFPRLTAEERKKMEEKSRIQKLLAAYGVASRRKAEELIVSGRVTVNGRKVKLGDSADPTRDVLRVDGEKVTVPQKKWYLALYKPRGFVTTMQDEKDRKCVAQLVKEIPDRVYPVGRLDKDSEGLLLMTNDGEFANRISHPKQHVPKVYRVTVRPGITEGQLTKLCTGVLIDGKKTAPAKARVLEQQGERVVLEIVLFEGRNREIRKMCEALGLEVARLKRTAIGPVRLGMLRQGSFRELSKEEVRGLLAESKKEGGRENDRNPAYGGQRKGTGAAFRAGRGR